MARQVEVINRERSPHQGLPGAKCYSFTQQEFWQESAGKFFKIALITSEGCR